MKEHEPKKVVQVVFSAYEKTSAGLKLKIRNDNLTQTSWFSGIVSLYLSDDPDMVEVMFKIKRAAQVMGKKKLKRTKEEIKKGQDIMKNLGITESDKQDIFDMIEMELGEHE